MQIVFALPHLESYSTSHVERDAVLTILNNALTALKLVHGVSRAASVSSPSGAVHGSRGTKKYTFNLPSFFFPGSSQTDDDKALRILLDALTEINTVYLHYHPNCPPLYPREWRSGDDVYRNGPVFYARTQIWDPIPALYRRGYGDCKSLSAALIADLRRKGIECEPVFRWVRATKQQRKGETNYHILVQHPRGFEDPSKVLGMGANALY